MVCSLLKKLVSLCSIYYSIQYPNGHSETVGMMMQSNGHSMVLLNNPIYRHCFLTDYSRDGPMYSTPSMHLIVDEDYSFSNHTEEEEDEEEEDDDEEDEEESVETKAENKTVIDIKTLKKVSTEDRKRAVVEAPKRSTPKPTPTLPPKVKIATFIQNQQNFKKSEDGKEAEEFCKKAGAKGNALKGCMQDMRLTDGNEKMAKRSVVATVKAQAVNKKKNRVVRACSATGDPHFTNFNGDYFHLQVPSIYVLARTKDKNFEVQVLQNYLNRQPVSYVRKVMIRYMGKTYANNFNQNGLSVETKGDTVIVKASDEYEGEMEGVCGENTANSGANNFRLPSGELADVDYKKPNWQMGGYGGPSSKLSRWHLAWKPTQCMFTAAECKKYL
jgi:von Willebrand factor type D domain